MPLRIKEGHDMAHITRQYVVTPAMGKRLIAKALAAHPDIETIKEQGTLVIVAGTTNGYVAEEVLSSLGQADGFSRKGFRRGMVVPPHFDAASVAADFPGDVVIRDGQWDRGKTIFDVVEDLHEGDIVLKGANAVDLTGQQAAVYVGHPQAGTAGAILPAVIGRRVRLVVPVGVEKRVGFDVHTLASRVNVPGAQGPRMLPLPGEIFTEIDALEMMTDTLVELIAGGGIYGAEGSVWLAVHGETEDVDRAGALIESLADEPRCEA